MVPDLVHRYRMPCSSIDCFYDLGGWVFDNFLSLPLTPPGREVLDGTELGPSDVLGRTHFRLWLSHSKMCSFVTQHNATIVSSFEECAIAILTTGMYTRAVARELNVNFSTISRLQRCFREFGSTSSDLTTADHVQAWWWLHHVMGMLVIGKD